MENTFHWTLDVSFREDAARLRSGDSAENFAVLRHVAFNLLKRPADGGKARQEHMAGAASTIGASLCEDYVDDTEHRDRQ